jgi:hypothetical protein
VGWGQVKDQLIQEIEQIYKDFGYRRQGRELALFSEEELQIHLEKLVSGAYPWMQQAAATFQSIMAY